MKNELSGQGANPNGQGVLALEGAEANLTARVNHGCARILRRNAIPSVLTNIVLSSLVAAIAWLHGHQTPAIAWFVVGLGINAIRIVIALNFDLDADPSQAKAKRWPRVYAVSAALSGCVWGMVGFLFIFPNQPEAATFFIVIVAGITAGSVSSSSSYFPALSSFLIPVLIPLALALALRQEPLFYVIAGTLVMYLLMVLFTGRNINHTLRRSLEARYRQEALVNDLLRARDEANVANRAKSEFLSSMSHEIRTPLHGILGIVELLRGGDLDETQRSRLDDAWDSCTALRTLVDDILDMGKIEVGDVKIEAMPFDLGELVESSRTVFGASAREKGLEFDIDTRLDAVRGDRKRIRQVVWNLLGNAVKFTPLGSVTLTLEWLDLTEDASGRSRLRVTVKDTGIGIEQAHLETLFKPFVQVDLSTTRRFGGSGLGLAIVSNVLKLMDGTISVQSVPWHGSTFTAEIPLERLAPEKLQNLPATTEGGRALRILLAEDQALNALVATELLERHGHGIDHVTDGIQAVEAATSLDYDLILMDVHMPFMDGAQAAREIRASSRGDQVSIIAVTADALASQFKRLEDAGVDAVLTKPYTDDELMTIVTKYGARRPALSGDTAPRDVGTEDVEIFEPASPGKDVDWRAADEAGFKTFATNRDPEMVRGLLSMARESTREQVDKLRDAIGENDPEAIFFAAHRLKGASGSIFASELSSLAADLEAASKDTDRIASIFPRIEAAADEALKWWAERERELA